MPTVKFWVVIELPFTGAPGSHKAAQEAVFNALPNLTNTMHGLPGINMGQADGSQTNTVSAIIEADDPLAATAFLGNVLKSALQVSGRGDVFDLAGALLRVAPLAEAKRIYEMTDGHGVLPPT